jgi:transcriptional regulator with XRE-family HTH domain
MGKQGADQFGRYMASYIAQSDRFPHATALARAAGISPAAVSRWINGKERPSPRLLEKLGPVMGVDAAELFAIAYPEIAGSESGPPEPLPRVMQQIMGILSDPQIPDDVKDRLLSAVRSALDLWAEWYKLRAPVERRATKRNNSVAARAD